MDIKVTFDNITVKEDKIDTVVKILMLKGEKGDQGDGENNVIEEVQVNGTALPVSNKAVNVPVPTVDSALNSTSENPVQNKVIYNALNDKVDNSDLNNYYQISEIDDLLNGKVDTSDLDNYYSKTDTDSLLNNKADASDVGDIDNLTTTDKTSVVNAINELETDKLETNAVVNEPSTETDEIYSSNYLNDKLVSVGSTAPTNSERVWFSKGKNIYDDTQGKMLTNATTSVENNVITITTTRTTTNNSLFYRGKIDENLLTNGKTYVLSYVAISGVVRPFKLQLRNHDGSNANQPQQDSVTYNSAYSLFVVGNPFAQTDVSVPQGSVCVVKNMQVEEGSTATDFEPYVEPSVYIDNKLLYCRPKILWQNTNPTAVFENQEITLNDNINNYKYYEIITNLTTSYATMIFSTGWLPTLYNQTRLSVPRHYLGNRSVSINQNKITFGHYEQYSTYGQTTASNNDGTCIPLLVLGYK